MFSHPRGDLTPVDVTEFDSADKSQRCKKLTLIEGILRFDPVTLRYGNDTEVFFAKEFHRLGSYTGRTDGVGDGVE